MSEPQGTHRVRSDDSETTGVDPQVATAVAESDPGGKSSQDELKKLRKGYIPTDESTRDKVGKGLSIQISQQSEKLLRHDEQLVPLMKDLQKGMEQTQSMLAYVEDIVKEQTKGFIRGQEEVVGLNRAQHDMMNTSRAEARELFGWLKQEMAELKMTYGAEVKQMREELRNVRSDVDYMMLQTSHKIAVSTQESSETQRENARISTESVIESNADEATLTEVSPFSQPEGIPRSDEVTSYSEEPSSLDIAIGEILDRVEVGHHILVEDPDDSTQIYIIGVCVERALADFNALTSQPDFQELNIVPHNVEPIRNGLPQYAKHLMRFGLEKNTQVHAQGRVERTTNHPKCQLIVTATHINQSSRADQSDHEHGYYGVTVAHAFLTHSQTERLLDSEQYDESIRTDMLEEAWNSQWSLRAQTANNRGLLKIVQPPLWDYREYFLDRDKFLQDIAVFRIPETKLRDQGWREVDTDTGEEQLLIFNSGTRKYKVGGLLPIRCHEDITNLCGKRVLIDSLEGTFNLPPRQVRRRGVSSDMQLGLHVTFRIKPPHSLEEGHSGLMAYVVDNDNTTVYIAGMLTGYLDKFEEISGKRVYQAVVVGEGLRRIEEKFPRKIRNVQMLKNKLANHTMRNLVDHLQDGPCMN